MHSSVIIKFILNLTVHIFCKSIFFIRNYYNIDLSSSADCINVGKMAGATTCVFFSVSLALCFAVAFSAEEACMSYAGGHVYPQETRRTTGHATHWSQVVSKLK